MPVNRSDSGVAVEYFPLAAVTHWVGG